MPAEHEARLHPEAARSPLRDGVRAAIDALAEDPRPREAVKLAGRNDYRIRVGDYRVVYAVDDRECLLIVAPIAHRRDVFRR